MTLRFPEPLLYNVQDVASGAFQARGLGASQRSTRLLYSYLEKGSCRRKTLAAPGAVHHCVCEEETPQNSGGI